MSEFTCPRRDFLKMTAVGAAGLAIAQPGKAQAAAGTGWPATGSMAINPAISNLRVVSCYDPLMIINQTGLGNSTWNFAGWNAAVNSSKIMANLDQMAKLLAQTTTAAAAWSTIFRKPASKSWSQVNAAIKVNLLSPYTHPRLAIVQKICQVLSGFGIPANQIIIYDCQTGSTANSNQMGPWVSCFSQGAAGSSLIPGVTSNGSASLGGSTSVAVAGLTNANHDCATAIANGTIDILVNVAVNKSHEPYAGGTTLCMKNHYGTFAPDHSDNTILPSIVFAMNKSAPILGGTPVRQQLCIVDSLWGDTNGVPQGMPTLRGDRLVMGTFAPAVDYFTVVNIQRKVMNSTMCTNYPDFLTSFGYATTDTGLQWVEFTPTATLPQHAMAGEQPNTLELKLLGGGAFASISLPRSSGQVEIRMFNIQGRSIKKMQVMLLGSHTVITWDGKNDRGQSVVPGNYIVRVSGRDFSESGSIRVG